MIGAERLSTTSLTVRYSVIHNFTPLHWHERRVKTRARRLPFTFEPNLSHNPELPGKANHEEPAPELVEEPSTRYVTPFQLELVASEGTLLAYALHNDLRRAGSGDDSVPREKALVTLLVGDFEDGLVFTELHIELAAPAPWRVVVRVQRCDRYGIRERASRCPGGRE